MGSISKQPNPSTIDTMKTQSELITDEQSLVSAKNEYGREIPVYDDGFGPLFIHRDSMGITGIVRAQTWEDAYGICEDEFFPEASDTVQDMEREYSTHYISGRELWLYENGNDFNRWAQLTDEQQMIECRKEGKRVPFDGEFSEHPYWQESYRLRPNGPNNRDTLNHGIYAKDLNGDRLDLLTPEMLNDLKITLEIADA